MCEDKYDTLVVDVGCVMGDMREELNVLSELMEEDAKNYLQYQLDNADSNQLWLLQALEPRTWL